MLVNVPLLHPPDYYRDFSLYLAAAFNTISMVLVQDDDDDHEHVIYYLFHNLLDLETHYAHIEKLVLDVFQVVQHFRHYILLCTVKVIFE